MVLEFFDADVCSNCKRSVKNGCDYPRYQDGKFCKLLSHAKVNTNCNTRFQLQSSTYLRNAAFTEGNSGVEAEGEGIHKKTLRNAEKSVGYVMDLVFGLNELKRINDDIDDFSTLSIPLCCKCVQYLTTLYRSYVDFCDLMHEESFLKKCIIQLKACMAQAQKNVSEDDEVQIKCEVDFDDNFSNNEQPSPNLACQFSGALGEISSSERIQNEDEDFTAREDTQANAIVETAKGAAFLDNDLGDDNYDDDNYEPISNDFVPSGDELDDVKEDDVAIKDEFEAETDMEPPVGKSVIEETVSNEISNAKDEIYPTSSTCADLSKGPWVVIKKITGAGTDSPSKVGARKKSSMLDKPPTTGSRTSRRSKPFMPEIIVLSDDSADAGSSLSDGKRRSTRERAPVILMQIETWKTQTGAYKTPKKQRKSELESGAKRGRKGKKSAQRGTEKKSSGAKRKAKTGTKSKKMTAAKEGEEDCADDSSDSDVNTEAAASSRSKKRAKRSKAKRDHWATRGELNQDTRSVNNRYMRRKFKYRHPCWHCSEHFETQAECAAHTKKKHSKLGNFMCETCSRVCQNETVYSGHLKVCANFFPGELTVPHLCPHCPRKFPTAYDLKVHSNRHAPVRRFPCKKCSFSTHTNFLIKMHYKRKHPPPNKKIRHYPCKECGKLISSKLNLKSHIIRMHTEEGRKAYKLQLITAGARNNEKKRQQRALARLQETYICEMCKVDCFSKRRLAAHRRIYHATDYQKYDYVCEQCGRDFKCHKTLVTHIQFSHTEDRPYMCEQCGRSYKSMPNLNDHVKHTHSEEGRQKYNEKMRIHQRKRKLLAAALAAKKQQAAASSEVTEPREVQNARTIPDISAPITTAADAAAAYMIPVSLQPVVLPPAPIPQAEAPPPLFQQELNFQPINYNYNLNQMMMPYPFNYPNE